MPGRLQRLEKRLATSLKMFVKECFESDQNKIKCNHLARDTGEIGTEEEV